MHPALSQPYPALTPRTTGRAWVHALLALATFATLSLAGGTYWLPLDDVWERLTETERVGHAISAGLIYAISVFSILGAHEMGHYLACRYYRVPATLPYFLPFIPPIGSLGAVIRIRGAIPHRKALFDIAAAGPIAGFLVTVPITLVGVLRARAFVSPSNGDGGLTVELGEPVLLRLLQHLTTVPGELAVNPWIGAGWVGLLVTSLNLFPVGQLDGGHAAYAISRRAHRALAWTTIVAMVGVLLAQVTVYGQFPFYVVWFAILVWMRDRHPRLIDESTTLGPGRKLVALLLLLIFALSFILVPIHVG
jgi:membrane-associated protease RseP (regulator of RpoE activity)